MRELVIILFMFKPATTGRLRTCFTDCISAFMGVAAVIGMLGWGASWNVSSPESAALRTVKKQDA
ncbi:MAG: hypothetical protein IJS28_12365 [Synergistaceae bacterium]|nr:hypothetical protein [Synergistaceae bacterium]